MARRSAGGRGVIRFFNLYEPVTSIYRDVVPRLCEEGWDVEIVCSKTPYRNERESLSTALRGTGSRIKLIPAPAGASSALGRLMMYMVYSIGAALTGLFGRSAEMNIVLTQPPLLFAWFRVVSHIRRQRYVCHVMDIYPDVLVGAGLVREGSLKVRLARRINALGLQGAERVVVIGRDMSRTVRNLGIDAERISIVPNWADEANIRPIGSEKNPQRAVLGGGTDILIGYAGNMGYSHQFDDVLKIAEQMVCESGVRFVFVGDGVRRQSVEQAVRERELTNVTFRPFQPEDVLAETLSAIDIHIITLREEFAGLVVPSKIYGVLAAGRPVVYSGPEESEVAEFVREWSVGYVVAAGDQDALRRAIEALVRDEGLRRELGRRGREVAEAQCGKDVSVERYMRALSLRE